MLDEGSDGEYDGNCALVFCKVVLGIFEEMVSLFCILMLIVTAKELLMLIRINNEVTDMFDILTGVRQGCILSPFLFLIVIDFLVRKTVDGQDYGITWGTGKLTDLDFADDIALISDSPGALQSMTTELQGNAAKVGLRISAEKTKAMAVGNTQTVSLSVEHKDIEFVVN